MNPSPSTLLRKLATAFVALLLMASWPGMDLAVDDCPDAWISTKISTQLVATMGFPGTRINPDTELCVVTLRGCVKTGEHRQKALATATKIKKVKQVIDKLKTCESD